MRDSIGSAGADTSPLRIATGNFASIGYPAIDSKLCSCNVKGVCVEDRALKSIGSLRRVCLHTVARALQADHVHLPARPARRKAYRGPQSG